MKAEPRDDCRASKGPAQPRLETHIPALLTVAAAVGAFYALQLAGFGTIQYDAVDVHYSSQAFFSEQLRAGHLPFWTPYLFSGYPFLADPQVGAWYLPNWPFFLAGITPASIEYELALHTLIACIGAYWLGFRLFGHATGAVGTALFYGLSGFFAAHSQHVGMFQTAAWLPWLLVAVDAIGQRLTPRRLGLAGLLGGTIILAGHFQTALYVFTASVLFAGYLIVRSPERWRRLVLGLAVTGVLSLGVSAIEVLPGLELARESLRSNVDATTYSIMYFQPPALLTLVWPNALGTLWGDYTGWRDISQYYWYSGVLCVPLAALGFFVWRHRLLAVLLIGLSVWYAAGPALGLYLLVARLPGFHSVVGPINGWFVPALGLALLGGAGLAALLSRFRWPVLRYGVILFTIGDLVFWNSVANRTTYDHHDVETQYTQPVAALQSRLSDLGGGELRLHTPSLTRVGYLNWSLQTHTETTYGYNPLELTRYRTYFDAALVNPRLVTGLAANYAVTISDSRPVVQPLSPPLPLAYTARHLTAESDSDAIRGRLASLDPAQETLVQAPTPVEDVDPAASATILDYAADKIAIRYQSSKPALIRTAIPIYPGWHATLDGMQLPLAAVDLGFVGVVAPAGEGTVQLRYLPNYFVPGAAMSVASLVIIVLSPTALGSRVNWEIA